uniref:Uncharacterized protein n=1 Tax=Oryza brachyantha TaxID=4533 RepID=J3MWK0_ORYBR
IVEKKKDLINESDGDGSSPLHFAASVGIKGITKLLIDSAREQNVIQMPDNEGMFPIHIASSVGAMDAIESLIDADDLSSAAVRNAEGKTFLHIAVENGNRSVVEFVCVEPRPKLVLNMKDNDGNTALHLSVQKRDETIFSYLLGNKYVELSHANNKGYTPLDLASKIRTGNPFASPQV